VGPCRSLDKANQVPITGADPIEEIGSLNEALNEGRGVLQKRYDLGLPLQVVSLANEEMRSAGAASKRPRSESRRERLQEEITCLETWIR
jgi:hypothetical protein